MSLILGFDSQIVFQVTGTTWPSNAAFVSQVRDPLDRAVLATLSTASGSIEWVDASTVKVIFAGSVTRDWAITKVVLDIVRVDVDPDQHLGFIATATFARAITQIEVGAP